MKIDKAEYLIQKYNMLPEGASVLAAVSGGADSVCLLHYLAERGVRVVCAHFNHRLRGEEADRDERFVRELCLKLGVEFTAGSGDVRSYASENGLGLEEAARNLRYAFLRDAARRYGCSRIATAHNADDNAETVLLNLARGAGLHGAAGIAPVRGELIRPLLGTTRAEIERYLELNGLEHVEDSTNAEDFCARNRLRHSALPLLREINPRAAEHIFDASESMREDDGLLASLAEDAVRRHFRGGRFPAAELAALPEPVAARVVLSLCPRAERRHVAAVMQLCAPRRGLAHADLPGLRVSRQGEYLIFGSKEPVRLLPRVVEEDASLSLPEVGAALECTFIKCVNEIYKSFNTFFFKNESICGRILVASRSDGDRVRLAGRGCTKSLKKLFSEAGLSPDERERIPIIYDDAGVIGVFGFGTAERCAAKRGDDVIKIEIRGLDAPRGTK